MSQSKQHGEKQHSGGGHGPGGGSHEEREGAPEWLISFADNVTLLMSFFVIMLAMNLQPKPTTGGTGDSKETGGVPATPEMLDMAIAIRQAFHNPVDPNSSNPIDLPLVRRLIERLGPSQSEQDGQMGREHDVRSIRPTGYFSPAGSVPFGDGSTSLNEAGRESLRQMTKALLGHNLVIEVRGHISAAEAFGKPDRSIRLSYDRALAVAEVLAAEGVQWSQIRVVACGDGERLVPIAYDVAGHRTNQRVELIVTDQVMNEHADEESAVPPNPLPRAGPP